jgi:hypothetical protein
MTKLKFKNFSATAKVYDGKEILDKADLYEVSVVDKKPREKKYRRTRATDFKKIQNDMIALLQKVKQKNYTEKEIEEAIHRERVLERRRQIALQKLDSGWDKLVAFEIKKVEEYKKHGGIYISIKNLLLQLLP